MEALDIKNITMLKDRIKNSALFLTNIIHELEEATGEDVNKIATANHSLNFFENKLYIILPKISLILFAGIFNKILSCITVNILDVYSQ